MKKLNKLYAFTFLFIFLIGLYTTSIQPILSCSAYTTSSASPLLPEVNQVDAEEISSDDWGFVLDLEQNSEGEDDFSFIKNSKENPNDLKWILYVGIGLIALSIIGIIYVIISSINRRKKYNPKH